MEVMSKSSFKFACKTSPFIPSSDVISPNGNETVKQPQLSQETLPSIDIPTIDMNDIDHGSLVSKISGACGNYGFFQVINHGCPSELYQQMMKVATDFFQLPYEEREKLYSDNPTLTVKVDTPRIKLQNKERVAMWLERLSHPADPVNDDYIHLLPDNPPQYREVAAAYSKEVSNLVYKLLGLISEGLGLETEFLEKRLSNKTKFHQLVNFYPPCPEPELGLGLQVHTDIGLITVIQQVEGVSGLQVIKDGKWFAVDPLPGAFIIIIADQLEVMSNGRLKSVHHRAVINEVTPRISIGIFCRPSGDAIIGPIEELTNKEQPPLYRNYRYEEFFEEFTKQFESRWNVKKLFQLQPSS